MKNFVRCFLGVFLVFFCVVPSFSQNFSRTYNQNLPIAYTAMLGIPQFPAKNLFVAGSFKAKSSDTDLVGSIESTNNTNGVFSASILIKKGNQNAMRFTLNLQSDTDGDFNYVTYVNIKNLLTAETNETRWRNGDTRTAGQLTGMLIEIINMVYDKNKLFGPEYAAAQKKYEQEVAEQKAREEKAIAERKAREEKISTERQKLSNFSRSFSELPSYSTLKDGDFTKFMQLCREYFSTKFEYGDDYSISSEIRSIDSKKESILSRLTGQQKVDYYTEFDPSKVEQAKQEVEQAKREEEEKKAAELKKKQAEEQELAKENKMKEAEAFLNSIIRRCEVLDRSIMSAGWNKQQFAIYKQIYKDFIAWQISFEYLGDISDRRNSDYLRQLKYLYDISQGYVDSFGRKMTAKQKKEFDAEFKYKEE